MDKENITPDTLPQVGGEGAVENQEQYNSQDQQAQAEGAENNEAMTLSEINSHLGKNFQDKETALKALKDTFSFVGKKSEDATQKAAAELKKSGYMTKEDFEDALFLRDNPQHSQNKEILEAIAKSKNITFAEAAKDESYSRLYERAVKFEESESKRSVMEPNPRLASAQGRTSKVSELQQAGRQDDAAAEGARAVMEAYGFDA